MWLALALLACGPRQAELEVLAKENSELETRVTELETQTAELETRLAVAEAKVESWDRLMNMAMRHFDSSASSSEQSTSQRPLTTTSGTEDTAGCTLLEDGRYQLTAPFDPQAHSASVRFVPYMKDGERQGYRVSGIRRTSFMATCGFRNGDVVLRLGGQELDTMNNTLAAFQDLSDSPETTVEVIRRHQTKTWQILAAPEGTEPGGSGN